MSLRQLAAEMWRPFYIVGMCVRAAASAYQRVAQAATAGLPAGMRLGVRARVALGLAFASGVVVVTFRTIARMGPRTFACGRCAVQRPRWAGIDYHRHDARGICRHDLLCGPCYVAKRRHGGDPMAPEDAMALLRADATAASVLASPEWRA